MIAAGIDHFHDFFRSVEMLETTTCQVIQLKRTTIVSNGMEKKKDPFIINDAIE